MSFQSFFNFQDFWINAFWNPCAHLHPFLFWDVRCHHMIVWTVCFTLVMQLQRRLERNFGKYDLFSLKILVCDSLCSFFPMEPFQLTYPWPMHARPIPLHQPLRFLHRISNVLAASTTLPQRLLPCQPESRRSPSFWIPFAHSKTAQNRPLTCVLVFAHSVGQLVKKS